MATIHIKTIVAFVIVILTAAKNLPESESKDDDKQQEKSAPPSVVSAVLDKKKNVKEINNNDNIEKFKRECGVFNTQKPTDHDEAPIEVSCDHLGEGNCVKLCAALAQAAKEKGPQVLCSALGHCENLKNEVFFYENGLERLTPMYVFYCVLLLFCIFV